MHIIQFVETHAHLDMMKRELKEVIVDARQKGVDKIIDKQVKEREHRRRKRLEEHKRKKLLK